MYCCSIISKFFQRTQWLNCIGFAPGKTFFTQALLLLNHELKFLIFIPIGILYVKIALFFFLSLLVSRSVLILFWVGFCDGCVMLFWIGCCCEGPDVNWELSWDNFFWILKSTPLYFADFRSPFLPFV